MSGSYAILLSLDGLDTDTYNCFPGALVAQTRASLSIGPVATGAPSHSATEGIHDEQEEAALGLRKSQQSLCVLDLWLDQVIIEKKKIVSSSCGY